MRCCLAIALLLGGCGRWGFETGPDGGAPGGGEAGDVPPVEPQVTPITGIGDQQVFDVALGPDGAVALIGGYATTASIGATTVTTAAASNDLFLGVMEAGGTGRWLVTLGASTMGSGQNVAWDADAVIGGGYFAGTTSQIGPLSAGSGQDVVLLRYTSAGTLIGATGYGGSANTQLRGLDALGGTIAAVGVYSNTVDFGAGPLPSTSADNGFLVTGLATTPVHHAFTASSDVFVNDVAFDPAGGVCITGRFVATTDFGGGPVSPGGSSGFVAKYDAGLGHRWVRVFGTSINGSAVAAAANGDCIAAGSSTEAISIDGLSTTSAGGDDVYVLRLEAAAGAASWLRTVTGALQDDVFGVEAVANDGVAIAGRFAGTTSFAGQTVQAEGATDGYVMFLTGDGSLDRVEILGGSGSITSVVGGTGTDAAGTAVGVGLRFSGELRVGTTVITAADDDGAVVVVRR